MVIFILLSLGAYKRVAWLENVANRKVPKSCNALRDSFDDYNVSTMKLLSQVCGAVFWAVYCKKGKWSHKDVVKIFVPVFSK